jgi:hypothetical protein
MKKFSLIIIGFLSLFSISRSTAQTVAMDFTQSDCDGTNHHLFSELDQGQVVVLTYVMLGCSSCIVGTNGLKSIVEPFAISHPGRVKVYNIGYTNSYSCSQLLNWRSSNGFSFPIFSGGATQVNYYGGMGMPTIVVVGSNNHTIYYKNLGYTSTDDPAITAAIQSALLYNPQGIEESLEEQGIHIFPSLFTTTLDVYFDANISGNMEIYDLTGKLVFSCEVSNQSSVVIPTEHFMKGVYMVRFRNNNGKTGQMKIVKS